jgi:carbonyl reductase 1
MVCISVVTVANKGIGFSIAKKLCQLKSSFDVVYLTARDEKKGMKAIKELKSFGYNAIFHQLDIDSLESIEQFRDDIYQRHGGLDILINNAGVSSGSMASLKAIDERAKVIVKTNFFGTLQVCNALVPLIRQSGRVVHVSSQSGHKAYSRMTPYLQSQFDAPDLTKEKLMSLLSSYVFATAQGNHEQLGWPSSPYGISKAGVTALCTIQQRDYDLEHQGDVIFSACCPGYCDTDMTGHKGPRHPDIGAKMPFYLATVPSVGNDSRGKFWFDMEIISWNSSLNFEHKY